MTQNTYVNTDFDSNELFLFACQTSTVNLQKKDNVSSLNVFVHLIQVTGSTYAKIVSNYV